MTTAGHPTTAQLAAYRAAVDELAHRIEQAPGDQHHLPDGLLEESVDRAEMHVVLDRLPTGAQGTLARLDREIRAFRPSARANAATPATLAKILLLQQVDLAWWSSVTPFADDGAVARSAELVSLERLRQDGRLGFRFRVPAVKLPARLRNVAVRRYAPEREPRTSGLSYPLARPAVVGVLNEVAGRFAEAAPGWRRGLWVNCIVRSDADQQRLRDLGYSAFLPSAHCTGHAADIEMTWLRQHGVAAPLQEILIHYRDTGILNVIDEGQAWHVCLNPEYALHYESAAALGDSGDGVDDGWPGSR